MDDDRIDAGRFANAESQWVRVRPEWVQQELARRSCLDMLMSRFGLDAALVSVPQLGKMLGMSKSTIYASIKSGKFFIPHRLIGASPVFTIDNVVAWYLTGHVAPQSKSALAGGAVNEAGSLGTGHGRGGNGKSFVAHEKRLRDRAVDAMVSKALSSMAPRTGGRV